MRLGSGRTVARFTSWRDWQSSQHYTGGTASSEAPRYCASLIMKLLSQLSLRRSPRRISSDSSLTGWHLGRRDTALSLGLNASAVQPTSRTVRPEMISASCKAYSVTTLTCHSFFSSYSVRHQSLQLQGDSRQTLVHKRTRCSTLVSLCTCVAIQVLVARTRWLTKSSCK